jgi:predicted TIM-barrel fold metal-dependent hydrolase
MVDRVGSERVLFGSDGPFHSFIAEFGAVVYARISEEAKENVLGRNTARLLHLS